MRTASPIAVLVGAALVTTATPALATRAPSKHERTSIVSAVTHSKQVAGVPKSKLRVSHVRVSTKGPYARAHLTAGSGVQPADVVLRKRGGRWKVKVLGTAGLGCGLPSAVQRDLRVSCSGG